MHVNKKCLECGKKIPWVCFVGNLTLGIFKVTVGFISGSKGLIADGIHSGSDVLATLMVIISLKISSKGADRAHPWGYGNVEYIGSLFVYTILLCIGGYIFVDAIIHIFFRTPTTPHVISLFAAMVSIASNIILSSYGFCAGKRLNSPAMIANANENRADMFSSVAVVLGIVGSIAGIGFADALAAIVVAVVIIKMSGSLLIQAFSGLMDKSIDQKSIGSIKAIALRQKGVSGINYIRTRRLGGSAWVELEIFTDPSYSVTEANAICSEVRSAIFRRAMHIREVVISFTSDWRSPYHPGKDKPRKRIFNFGFKQKSQSAFSNMGSR